MRRKMTAYLLCLCLLAALLGGCGKVTETGATATDAAQTPGQTSAAAEETAEPATLPEGEFFSDGDTKDVTGETADAEILLSGSTGTISDTTRGASGSTVTITAKGIYRVSGSAEGVQILVDDSTKSGNIYLILDSVTMVNAQPCIYVESADKVILQCLGSSSLTSTDGDSAAVYAEDDLTLNGSGSLSLSGGKQGLVCENDLKLVALTLTVEAETIGVKAEDSLCIQDADVTVNAGHDGVQVESEEGDGYFYLGSGSLEIRAGWDGVQVASDTATSYTGWLYVRSGSLSITAGGGSGGSKSDTGGKGLKCAGDIFITGGSLEISGSDDAIHADASVYITGGELTLSSSDDGVCAYSLLEISGGEVAVLKSYEGLGAETIRISGGSVSVKASDDGLNAAGGSDSSSTEWTPWSSGSASGTLSISGGTVYVDAGGDGLDSNGSIYISGGLVLVEGPVNSGNGALDKGDGSGCAASITGGTVLALGTADMALNFDSGTQCSALVAVSGAAGTTITVDDGSGFSFTTTKSFACAVYSSPSLSRGSTYTLRAGSAEVMLDFSSGLYYSTVSGGMGGHMDGPMGGKH